MKIDNLMKNLQKNAAEQEKTMQEQAQSVTEQHLTSYSMLLRSSRNETEQALAENIKLIRESRTALQQALAWKTMLGALLGVLVTVFLILLAMNLWAWSSLKDKKAELEEVTQKIDRSPIEQKLLAKITVMEWGDEKGDEKGIAITPKTKAVWKTDTNGDQSLFIKK